MSDDPKSDLRRRLRAARKALTASERERQAAEVSGRIIVWLSAQGSTELASYLAMPEELSVDAVHQWWWGLGRAVWLPRVVGPGQLAWHPIRQEGDLQRGTYGIREPDPQRVVAGLLPGTAVMLVPGVGFTAAGERLGMGGGFYDRLLGAHRGPTLGVGFACQRCDQLPTAGHDQPVAQVLFGS
jgi:5-formyltetrahydrofolate cyclo-ligase